MATFRKIKLEIWRGRGYGQYIITATYKGKEVKAHTTDSEAYDYLEDDSNKQKHKEAKRHCYSKIVYAYDCM